MLCASTCAVLLLLSCVSTARASSFESADVVPVRIPARSRGRLWKRSAEPPVFALRAFGEELLLNLVPDASFMAPSFSIRRIRAADSGVPNRTQETDGSLRGCFYSGRVGRDRDSVVAVSLCSGIFGSFITNGKQFFIEPKQLGGLPRPDSAERPHLIRRRTIRAETFTHGAGDAGSARRDRRFVSAPRFIETLAVADLSMSRFYGEDIKVRPHTHTRAHTVNALLTSSDLKQDSKSSCV